MNGCMFVTACSQETTASDHWQEATEHFAVLLDSKVCDAGFSRPRSSCNSAFGCLDRSRQECCSLGIAWFGIKHGELEAEAGNEYAGPRKI